MQSDTEYYIERSRSMKCDCGEHKPSGMAFCPKCIHYLNCTDALLHDGAHLWNPPETEEFKKAYDRALQILDKREETGRWERMASHFK